MHIDQVYRIFRLTERDPKPLYGILAHLTSEVGELAEAVEIHQGHSNKTPTEPLIGEVADVIQCALSVLARAYKDVDHAKLLDDLNRHFVSKNNKWEEKQEALIRQMFPKEDQRSADPSPRDFTITEHRVMDIIAEQLGVSRSSMKPADLIIEDYRADSLDTVELAMALEDAFAFELSDAQEDYIERHVKTVRDVLNFMNQVVGK